jgi:hypothetical protein
VPDKELPEMVPINPSKVLISIIAILLSDVINATAVSAVPPVGVTVPS